MEFTGDTKTKIHQATALRKEGKTLAAIGKELNCSASYVRRLLKLPRYGKVDLSPVAESDDFVSVSEDGEGQENECPICGAEPGQSCSGEDPSNKGSGLGVEYGRLIHRARQNIQLN